MFNAFHCTLITIISTNTFIKVVRKGNTREKIRGVSFLCFDDTWISFDIFIGESIASLSYN